MIKSDVIDELYRCLGGISRQESSLYVSHVFCAIEEALARNETVKVTNFGVFQPRQKRARIGRNPRTLEAAEISARRVVTFRISDSLARRLNSREADLAIAAREEDLADFERREALDDTKTSKLSRCVEDENG